MSRAAEPHGTVVVFVHHARKPKADDVDGARYKIRGSGALFDACGSVLVFSAEKAQPTRISHEKCRNRGVLVDDFGLRVEDIEANGDPRAGLRVVHLDAEQLAKADGAGTSAYSGAIDRIATFLQREGGEFRGAKSSLRERIGNMGRDRFFAAFEEMISTGRVTYSEDQIGRVVRLAGPEESGTIQDHSGPTGTVTDGPVWSAPLGGRTADQPEDEPETAVWWES